MVLELKIIKMEELKMAICKNRVDDSARVKYEKDFNNKIDYFKDHEKYEWLRRYADDALRFHIMYGFYAIKAQDFMKRIVAMDLDYIKDWLDGKNQLEWAR